MNYQQKVIEIIVKDKWRLQALKALRSLNLTDCWIAAGFVRNAVWDNEFNRNTPLNDIDVIYFSLSDITVQRDKNLEQRLKEVSPSLPWSVKNQARMHIRNSSPAYSSCLHAMSFWPEKQTGVAVKIDSNNQLQLLHSFELSLLFNRCINYNSACPKDIFNERVKTKGWLTCWPELQLKN